MNRFAYAAASSLQEALQVLDQECRPLAGGTDLVGMLQEGLVTPDKLVSLKRIPDLDRVKESKEGLYIGAMTPLSRLVNHPLLGQRPDLACLVQALRQTASPQIRHMATLGGNLLQRPRCWYFRNKLTHCLRKGGPRCMAFRGEDRYHAILGGGPCYIVHPSDPAVALLALDASATIVSTKGSRTVPLENLYLLPRQDPHREVDMQPDELLIEVLVPTPPSGATSAYHKIAEHGARDFALVSVAIQLARHDGTVQRARVVLGGVAPVPWRAVEAEKTLLGKELNDITIERAAQAATAGARPLAQNAYKVDLARNLVRQALHELGAPAISTEENRAL